MGVIYQVYCDYEILASNSYDALRGLAPGWCDIDVISTMPLIYNLISDDICFGVFKLRKKLGGICEIEFADAPFEAVDRTEPEIQEILSISHEQRRMGELLNKLHEKQRERQRVKLEHLKRVVKLYFDLLTREGIKLTAPVMSNDSADALNTTAYVNSLHGLFSYASDTFQAAQDLIEAAANQPGQAVTLGTNVTKQEPPALNIRKPVKPAIRKRWNEIYAFVYPIWKNGRDDYQTIFDYFRRNAPDNLKPKCKNIDTLIDIIHWGDAGKP